MDGQNIQLDQGLSFIQSSSMRHGLLDELTIELMIYVIEELLESVQMQYAQPKTAVTSDVLFQKALTLFFPDQQQIDRVQLESAFNTKRQQQFSFKVLGTAKLKGREKPAF